MKTEKELQTIGLHFAEMPDCEQWLKADNLAALQEAAIYMNWPSLDQFLTDTGVEADYLIGHWFQVIHGRVYRREEEKTVAAC